MPITTRTTIVTTARHVLAAAMLLAPWVATAQPTTRPATNRWEFRVASGSMMPVGEQRESLRSGSLTAAQIAWAPQPSVAIVGSFGWARSRDLASVGSPKLSAYTAELGVEARAAEWHSGRAVTFTPFIGVGAGARSYDYRQRSSAATHNVAGYGAVGGEVGFGRVGLRLEARNHVSGFKPLTGVGTSDTRNDVSVLAAVRLNRRAPSSR